MKGWKRWGIGLCKWRMCDVHAWEKGRGTSSCKWMKCRGKRLDDNAAFGFGPSSLGPSKIKTKEKNIGNHINKTRDKIRTTFDTNKIKFEQNLNTRRN